MAIITIIGAGNGAHALAADCKLGGAEVRMYEFTRFNNKVKGIVNSRRIRFEGIEKNHENFKRNGTIVLDMVTYDMKEAVQGANHILVSVQAQGFESIFEELAPLLEDGQTVSIFPDNYGSLILRRIMKEKGLKTDVIIAGYCSLVYGARLTDFNNMETETDVVNVMYRENEIRVDTLPSSDYATYLEATKEIPALDATELIQGDTVLDIGLSNVNVLLHVPAVVLNTGTIENWGIIPNVGSKDAIYDIYAHGVSPAVGRVQYAFYLEQVAIAKAFGVGIMPVEEDVLQSRMGLIGQMMFGEDFRLPFTEPLDQSTWLPAPKGARFPLDSRYITEDVPVGCSGAMSFAELLQVETPIIRAMTDLSNLMLETNYYETGYNLKDFGLENMTPADVIGYMRTGK
ncbi:NAD/NADP-dependent octopine/nopaline dehydrogenase family protein [Photobacterium sp. OFAV2-7]|uniref:NAD/NADP-dependent octopine/nopaline dehydrogenase family protein n=1 Tax=Photobacterium sp. OFAV2-7 TaxID=2917748 RepID=UPI001EF5720F|nr:NAD/NADP-dependent octopine/nopaline dehydrogenase family protein [Photobacterium sp. OFAV2-7]MCG7587265.1 NAD/NADP octopine/nopaline dehydrogenase family protein [Photobacterium sp. OFAV2-7]